MSHNWEALEMREGATGFRDAEDAVDSTAAQTEEGEVAWKRNQVIVSALRRRIADQQEVIEELRKEVALVKQEAHSQHGQHVCIVRRLQEDNRTAFVEREAYYTQRIDEMQRRQRQAEESTVTRLLQRLEFSQEYLGKALIHELKASFLPLNVYAQRVLVKEQLGQLCDDEASLRQATLVDAEAAAWHGTALQLWGEELLARARLMQRRSDGFVELLQQQEALHRREGVEAAHTVALRMLHRAFYEELFVLSPAKVFCSYPLRQLDTEEELWERAPDAARVAAARARRGRREGEGADAPPRQRDDDDGQNNFIENEPDDADEAVGDGSDDDEDDVAHVDDPEEARRDDQLFVQDERKKEQTFVGGGVLFHVRSHARGPRRVEGLAPAAAGAADANNAANPPANVPDEQEGGERQQAGGPGVGLAEARGRPILIERFEIFFDEPYRSPAELQSADPDTLADTLTHVKISLWLKKGSFLVSERERRAHVRQHLRQAWPGVLLCGGGGGRAGNADGDDDIDVDSCDSCDDASVEDEQEDDVAGRESGVGCEAPQTNTKHRTRARRWQLLLKTLLRDGDHRSDHRSALLCGVAPEEMEALCRQVAATSRVFERNEKPKHLDSILSTPAKDAAWLLREEGWVRLFESKEAKIGKNTTFVVPTNHVILASDTEYSFFIRVENKKVLKFTKRVVKKVIPSVDNDPANAVYTYEEEHDSSKFFYSPLSFNKYDAHIEMSGCRWNSRTEQHFFKLAPRNDDVFNGRIVYHVL